jgi:proteasome accessory factor B
MSPRITKLQRWLDLIAFLVGRRLPVSVEEIMEGTPAYAEKWVEGSDTDRASVRRTFERDKDELRKAGIPIESVAYHVNYGAEQIEGYALKRRDFYLPYLKLVTGNSARPATATMPYALPEIQLSEPEADLALGALREVSALPDFPFAREAKSAIRKLAFDLDPDAFGNEPVIYVDRPGAEEVIALIRPLSDALLARKAVRFRYHGIHRGEATQREVQPYGLFFQHGSWYLVGHDLGRSDIRVFRVGRMEEVDVNSRAPNTPDYSVPGDFALDPYLRRDAWELGDEEPLRARVLFHFPRSLWAERNRHGTLVEERADGATVREFDIQQTSPFLRWLLSLGADVEVLAPEAFAAELQAMVRQVAALYGEAR